MPAWSPAGGAIAYQTNASSDDFELWAIGARGEGNHRVLRDPGFDDVTPTWTPDGRRIVFSRCDKPFGFVAKCGLAIVNVDGTGRRTILGGNNLHLKPAVSSDGKTIAFQSDRGGLQSAIWLVNIDGSHLRRLTAAKTRAFWPDFTADGSHVLYSSNCCLPHSDIYSVPVGGGTATKLTNAPGLQDDVFESASPSGRNVLFWNSGTDPGQGTGKLVIRRSDGSQRSLLGGFFDAAVTDWGSAPLGPTNGDGSRLPASAGHATPHRAGCSSDADGRAGRPALASRRSRPSRAHRVRRLQQPRDLRRERGRRPARTAHAQRRGPRPGSSRCFRTTAAASCSPCSRRAVRPASG